MCNMDVEFFSDDDNDGTLNRRDLEKLINHLTSESEDTRLNSNEMEQLINNVSSLKSEQSLKMTS